MNSLPPEIVDLSETLLKLLLRTEDVSYRSMDKALRILRPAPAGDMNEYVGALKLRLKQAILSDHGMGSKGGGGKGAPVALLEFEKECDKLRRLNPRLLNSVLMMLEPLKFPQPANKNSFFSHNIDNSPAPSRSNEDIQYQNQGLGSAATRGMFRQAETDKLPETAPAANRTAASSSAAAAAGTHMSSSSASPKWTPAQVRLK